MPSRINFRGENYLVFRFPVGVGATLEEACEVAKMCTNHEIVDIAAARRIASLAGSSNPFNSLFRPMDDAHVASPEHIMGFTLLRRGPYDKGVSVVEKLEDCINPNAKAKLLILKETVSV